jgi:hypothetical protein
VMVREMVFVAALTTEIPYSPVIIGSRSLT